MKLLRSVYSGLLYLFLPLIVGLFYWKGRRNPAYRQRLKERFGFIRPQRQAPSIWIHAVSVGETIAAMPLVIALQQAYPSQRIVFTTTTPTGSEQAQRLLSEHAEHFYLPLDFPAAIRRFIKRNQVQAVILMESELWPNLLNTCARNKLPLVLANARISEGSARRYRRFKFFAQGIFGQLSKIAAQSQTDAQRFLGLGVPADKVRATGNLKFDLQLPEDLQANGTALRLAWQSDNRPTLIAASTHEGEDDIVLEAFRKIKSAVEDALLILVPRHPERFEDVKQLCEEKQFITARRSLNEPVNLSTDIILGDTMGELLLFYTASDVAFIGGSLVPIGGHNFIEAAAQGLPLLSGPKLQNFLDISNQLSSVGALKIVSDAQQLAEQVTTIFQTPDLSQRMGESARLFVAANKGALQNHLSVIQEVY